MQFLTAIFTGIIALFFTSMSLMEGKGLPDVKERLREVRPSVLSTPSFLTMG
jgi:hypothetical protein